MASASSREDAPDDLSMESLRCHDVPHLDKLHRDLRMLHVHAATLHCATEEKCIPCFYKLFPDGRVFDIKLPPNQRPEMCKRASSASFSALGLYDQTNTGQCLNCGVLTIGDGDFSFSLSLAKAIAPNFFVASSYESLKNLSTVYKNAISNIDQLKEMGVKVMHEVDATNLQSSLIEKMYNRKFNFIVWNFPCIRIDGGADAQVVDIDENKRLVKTFFTSAKSYLKYDSNNPGEIHVTHKTFEPFCWWDILSLASEAGLAYCGSVVFDRYTYPGYINRKALDNKSFPFFDAQTFVFIDAAHEKKVALSRRKDLVLLRDPDCLKLCQQSASVLKAEYDSSTNDIKKKIVNNDSKRKRKSHDGGEDIQIQKNTKRGKAERVSKNRQSKIVRNHLPLN